MYIYVVGAAATAAAFDDSKNAWLRLVVSAQSIDYYLFKSRIFRNLDMDLMGVSYDYQAGFEDTTMSL